MGYIDKLLSADEKILFATRKHFFVLFGNIFKEILIFIVLVIGYFAIRGRLDPNYSLWFQLAFGVLGLIVLVSILIDVMHWQNEEFFVTTRRVIHSKGVFSKRVLDSSLNKINDVILLQSWFGRM